MDLFMNLDYVLAKRTNGANPFKIFSHLERMDKDSIARAIKRMPYSAFLETAYWFAVSATAKSNAGMRCQICNQPNKIQAHHRTYDTHGYEHLNMMDLVVLCDNCHGLFHGHQSVEYIPVRLKDCQNKAPRARDITAASSQDLTLPDGAEIVVTRELVERCRANGSFTNATIRAFGIKRPLMHGWTRRLEGISISREKMLEALKGRYVYNSGPLEHTQAI